MLFHKKEKIVLSLCCVAFILLGCTTVSNKIIKKNGLKKNTVPADIFYKKRSSGLHYKISPNGHFISGITLYSNKICLFITSGFSKHRRIFRTHSNYPITHYEWLADNQRIVFSQPVDDDNQHIYVVDINKPDQLPQNLTLSRKGWWKIAHIGCRDNNKIWVWNSNCKTYVNLEVLDLVSQETEIECTASSPVKQWIIDADDQLRGRIVYNYSPIFQRFLELYDSVNSTWNATIQCDIDEVIEFLGFDTSKRYLWLLTNHNREHIALVKFDCESGKEEVVCQDSKADIDTVTMSRKYKKPLFAYSCPDYPKTFFLDEYTESLLKPYQPLSHKGFKVVDLNQDENVYAFLTYDCKRVDAYILDLRSGQINLVGDSGAILYSSRLSNKKPISITARDGMWLHGYITLPSTPIAGPAPTVLLVHGGPWHRDKWEYDYLAQFLANRGYVVLQINFRGSSGYGKTYMRNAIGEIGRGMHTDLVDSVQWAVKQGYSDPERTAIMGWSYGGYAALAGLTLTPDLFSCAIAIAGVSDWPSFLTAGYRNPNPSVTQWWRKYLGNPYNDEDKDLLAAVSPINHVEKITRPLLIVHGEKDKIVSSEESKKMVAAMEEAGKTVEYLYFPNEGHSFHNWETFSTLFQNIDDFLAVNLQAEH